jgi:hypothetical protein
MNQAPIRVSQDFELTPLKKGKAYPILKSEWDFLKQRVKNICDYTNWFYNLGWLFWGAGISTFITVMAAQTEQTPSLSRIVLWAAVITTAIIGSVCFISGYFLRKSHNVTTGEVVRHMEILEERFETNDVAG